MARIAYFPIDAAVICAAGDGIGATKNAQFLVGKVIRDNPATENFYLEMLNAAVGKMADFMNRSGAFRNCGTYE